MRALTVGGWKAKGSGLSPLGGHVYRDRGPDAVRAGPDGR